MKLQDHQIDAGRRPDSKTGPGAFHIVHQLIRPVTNLSAFRIRQRKRQCNQCCACKDSKMRCISFHETPSHYDGHRSSSEASCRYGTKKPVSCQPLAANTSLCPVSVGLVLALEVGQCWRFLQIGHCRMTAINRMRSCPCMPLHFCAMSFRSWQEHTME